MKILLLLLLTFFSYSLQAETLYKCKVSPIILEGSDDDEDNLKVDGYFELVKENNAFKLNAKISYSDDADSQPEETEGTDVATEVIITENSKPTLAELLNDSEAQLLVGRLNGEKPKELRLYVGKMFENDGAGLALTTLIGEKGTKASFAAFGWAPMFCD